MKTKKQIDIRPITSSDRPWVKNLIQERWGSNRIVTRGNIHKVDTLSGFIGIHSDLKNGLLTYKIFKNELEIVTLDSLVKNIGIGSALISAVRQHAQKAGCQRIWLITTNDNTPALRFYQKRGFHLVAIHQNAMESSRALKSEIPLIGLDGIPLRDEIELEIVFKS